jgi:outer membrane lipoprotein carrier protein
MQLKDNFGQTTLLRFSNLERNPALGGSLFRFTPPKGADVISE